MPLTKEQLDNWFTYHPPTDETRPKYEAIRKAEDQALALLHTPGVTHDVVNAVLRQFAETIDSNAPDSADKTAAIRCVRIARNAINEAIVVLGKEDMRSLFDASGIVGAYVTCAQKQLRIARWQANSAIACGGK